MKIQNQVLLLENNLLSELPSFLGSLPKLKILTIRCNFSNSHSSDVYSFWSIMSSHMKCVKVQFCHIISFCVQAEHDQLPTKGCSGRWLQVWPWVFFRARLAILLCLQMIYIFLIDKIRKILRYLSSVSDPPAINDWKRGLEIVVLFSSLW